LKECPSENVHIAVIRRFFALPLGLPQRGGKTLKTSSLARELARVPGIGLFTAKCILATAVVSKAAVFDVGIVGPGAEVGARLLLGLPHSGASLGLWPWQDDAANIRVCIAAVAKLIRGSWIDAQQALCEWQKEA